MEPRPVSPQLTPFQGRVPYRRWRNTDDRSQGMQDWMMGAPMMIFGS